jgi:hypothetical protein
MEINKIIEHFTKLRETQASNDKILKADLDIYLKQSSLRIVFSLLLKENILIYDDNDEIVLELFINRENSKGMVDISDSRGYYFFKDKEITICNEDISYLEELMYDSIKNITKV